MKEKIQIILGMVGFLFLCGFLLIAFIYPIYSGIRWWRFESKYATGAIDVPSLNSARGSCDHRYHIEKILYNELPDWCQKYKIKYENYKPIGIIPQ